jgi:hypothetical protein
MKRNNLWFALLFSIFLFPACVSLVVGGAAIGAGTVGTFYYIDGNLRTDYFASFDKVWSASEKAVADLRGLEVTPSKEMAQGKIAATINNDKVKIEITYKAKNQTTVSIRVGLMGDKLSSQLLHDKIAENLAKN